MTRYITLGMTLLAGVAIGAAAVGGLHAQAKPKAYTISEIQTLDPTAQAAYVPAILGAIKAAGGHSFNTAGGRVVGVVGEAPAQRVAINEWDSLEQAQAFYASDAWKSLGPQRDKAQKLIRAYAVEALK